MRGCVGRRVACVAAAASTHNTSPPLGLLRVVDLGSTAYASRQLSRSVVCRRDARVVVRHASCAMPSIDACHLRGVNCVVRGCSGHGAMGHGHKGTGSAGPALLDGSISHKRERAGCGAVLILFFSVSETVTRSSYLQFRELRAGVWE